MVTREDEMNFEANLESFKSTIAFGVAALKSLYMVSGGSAAALLAFIGHLVTNGLADAAKLLSLPLCVFFFASLLAGGSLGFSYLGQQEFTRGDDKHGAFFQLLAIVCTLLSYVACIIGGVFAYRAFMSF